MNEHDRDTLSVVGSMTRTKAEIEAAALAIRNMLGLSAPIRATGADQAENLMNAAECAPLFAAAEAALAAADAVAPKREEWFVDTSPDLQPEECNIEQPRDAFDCAPLGSIAKLQRCAVLATEEWQLVPVTATGDLCPCGKPEGCGDFLGVACDADRDEVRLWAELPEEWRL